MPWSPGVSSLLYVTPPPRRSGPKAPRGGGILEGGWGRSWRGDGGGGKGQAIGEGVWEGLLGGGGWEGWLQGGGGAPSGALWGVHTITLSLTLTFVTSSFGHASHVD